MTAGRGSPTADIRCENTSMPARWHRQSHLSPHPAHAPCAQHPTINKLRNGFMLFAGVIGSCIGHFDNKAAADDIAAWFGAHPAGAAERKVAQCVASSVQGYGGVLRGVRWERGVGSAGGARDGGHLRTAPRTSQARTCPAPSRQVPRVHPRPRVARRDPAQRPREAGRDGGRAAGDGVSFGGGGRRFMLVRQLLYRAARARGPPAHAPHGWGVEKKGGPPRQGGQPGQRGVGAPRLAAARARRFGYACVAAAPGRPSLQLNPSARPSFGAAGAGPARRGGPRGESARSAWRAVGPVGLGITSASAGIGILEGKGRAPPNVILKWPA